MKFIKALLIIAVSKGFVPPAHILRPVAVSTFDSKKEPEKDKKPDIIEEYSEWFGLFPKEQKWKNVRFTVYSVVCGYVIADIVQGICGNVFGNHDSLSHLL